MKEFEFEERIMGTDISVSIVAPTENEATRLFNASFERLKEYEAQFSRFIPTSELSQLNKKRILTVSPLFIKVLESARYLYKKTHGYFNPLLQVQRLGYTTTYALMQKELHLRNVRPYNVDFDAVIIDSKTRTVTLIEDQQLDFGGFLKGYLAEDEAKRIMREGKNVRGVIVNLGGDIHTCGRDEHNAKFTFEIEHPLGGTYISVPLENMSLATSGTYKRTWLADDKQTHHIVARDGTHNPVSDVISASVIHENGDVAEAYAKTLFTLEPDILGILVGEAVRYTTILNNGETRSSL